MTDTAPASTGTTAHGEPDQHRKAPFWALTLGSIGIVYGDIGTSPLYAFREALTAASVDGLARSEIIGIVSLMFWSLTIIVTLKYVVFLLRTDNNGEGGTLSLMALAQKAYGRRTTTIFVLGIAGASLFAGEAIITPAISVLSALEGLSLVTDAFDPYILPMAIIILGVLFSVQRHGTGRVSAAFGPICVVWFLTIGGLGAMHILDDPKILYALSPTFAVGFLFDHGLAGLLVLGSVFLTVTGCEALYADMGHFGRKPITAAWMWFVFPALTLNYFGQGALVLARPEAAGNPFFLLAPEELLVPLVILATMATVIASQAVITGAFSLTQQAVQLGLLPRMEIRRTSETAAGQIYMPVVNTMLFVGVISLVIGFGSSSALSHAYGIAVTGTMVVSSLLAYVIVRRVWGVSRPWTIAIIAPILLIELTFLSANLLKLFQGAYVPLLLGIGMMLIMWTWRRGNQIVQEKTRRDSMKLEDLLDMLRKSPPVRVPGTAVFLSNDVEVAPPALFHNLKHNKVLHEKLIMLTVFTASYPRVAEEQRAKVEKIDDDVTRVILNFGYMETPNVPRALARLKKQGLKFDIMTTSFFLGRKVIVPDRRSGMPRWQDKLFIALNRNATNATDFFQIPTGRVVELGAQVTV
ncbi:MAG: potassium transporter Kup [Alphaproteobacteria bacterium]|nr:potassium transporter Kup [Alphaproteobacteria bacterium]